VSVLVFGRGEHVQGAVASSGAVPDLDVVVDCAGELDPSLSSFAVDQLDLRAGPERPTIALSNGAPTAPTDGARPASVTFWLKTQDPSCTPRSE
jgi:hypothetical protein